MSLLSIALGEIQKPSLWDSLPASVQPRKNGNKKIVRLYGMAKTRRIELLHSIKARGGVMSVTELMEETGWSRQTVAALAGPLVNTGELTREVNNMKTTYTLTAKEQGK